MSLSFVSKRVEQEAKNETSVYVEKKILSNRPKTRFDLSLGDPGLDFVQDFFMWR